MVAGAKHGVEVMFQLHPYTVPHVIGKGVDHRAAAVEGLSAYKDCK